MYFKNLHPKTAVQTYIIDIFWKTCLIKSIFEDPTVLNNAQKIHL